MSKSKKDAPNVTGLKPSDFVSPPISDSTEQALRQLIGPKSVKKLGGKLPRKGWGE